MVGNSHGSYPRTKLYELMDEFYRSNQSKRTDLREKPEKENYGMMTIWSHVLGFLRLSDPPSRWRGSTIYIGEYLLDKIT